MPINSFDSLIGAPKQRIGMKKTASQTAVANQRTSVFDRAGSGGGAGTLAGTSVTAGVVPTDATAGCPLINNFVASGKGLISRLNWYNSVAGNLELYDMLFKAGAFPFNASQTLSAQPSYSSRVPNGTDFTNTFICIEAVTAFTGVPTITVTYTNQDGTTGRTTGAVAMPAALGISRCFIMPLQSGDTGVRSIDSVTCTVATVGTFNVLVLRLLGEARINVVNERVPQDFFSTGGVEVFADSALYIMSQPDSTATGVPEVTVDIANQV